MYKILKCFPGCILLGPWCQSAEDHSCVNYFLVPNVFFLYFFCLNPFFSVFSLFVFFLLVFSFFIGPGFQSFGPGCHSQILLTLNWHDSGWWIHQLNSNWLCHYGNLGQCGNTINAKVFSNASGNTWWPKLHYELLVRIGEGRLYKK